MCSSQDPADKGTAETAGNLLTEAAGRGGHADDLVAIEVIVVVHGHAVHRTAQAHHGDGGKAGEKTCRERNDQVVREEYAHRRADDANGKADEQGFAYAEFLRHRANDGKADEGGDQADRAHNTHNVVIAKDPFCVIGAGSAGYCVNDEDEQVGNEDNDPVFVFEELSDRVKERDPIILPFGLLTGLFAVPVEHEHQDHADRTDDNGKLDVGCLIRHTVRAEKIGDRY